MWLLRVAHIMQRVLLVQQEHPAPMETFFVPSLVDWSLGDLDIPEPQSVFIEWSL